MNRPVNKPKCFCIPDNDCGCGNEKYNEACNDWENFMPSENEIRDIIHDVERNTHGHYDTTDLAHAIHQRLMGGEEKG